MSTERTTSLDDAREKEAALYNELDRLTDEWVLAKEELRIAEIEEKLHVAEGKTKNQEQIDDLKTQLAFRQQTDLPGPDTVRKEGEIVTDIPWQNDEDVTSPTLIWSNCANGWAGPWSRSHRPNDKKVWASSGHFAKAYAGDFQLMRYQRKLFWIRK